MRSPNLHRYFWLVTAVLALVASMVGVAAPSVYEGLVSDRIMPAVFTQDVVTVVVAAALLVLSLGVDTDRPWAPAVALGLVGYLFYAYGIYSIERIYNWWYLVYLAVFGLSAYSVAGGVAALESDSIAWDSVPPWLRRAAVGFAIFTAAVFCIVWTAQLVPLLADRRKIELTYSIYILDLCFVMPGFVLGALQVLRGRAVGLVLLVGLFVAGSAILAPLALAELAKPLFYGRDIDPGTLATFGLLSATFAAMAGLLASTLDRNRASK